MNVENPSTERHIEGKAETQIEEITLDEIFSAIRKMKNGEAVGIDDIPAKARKVLGGVTRVRLLLGILRNIIISERIPNKWRNSTLIPIFKNKGDLQDRSNYRGIKLMSHTLKIWKRIIENRLRKGRS